ncbi:hypothetical protein GCM10028807_49900 [Spirosoma daeguense]
MDANQLINSGLFESIMTDGRNTLILQKPVTLVVPAPILKTLTQIYPTNKETGGFLYAQPDVNNRRLEIVSVVEIPNGATNDSTYAPFAVPYQAAIAAAVTSGLLPLRFHTHPLQTVNALYNSQSLNFFNKTSQTDRHTSYIPIWVGAQAVILPDCLISPNDREGKTIRFTIYNGFIAPNSFAALLPNEQVFIGVVVIALLLVWVNLGAKKAASSLVVCALIGVAVFVLEKRPTYNYLDSGLTITV